MLYYFGRYVIRPWMWLLMRPRVIGWKNLNRKGKVVYVCNHVSMADPIAIAVVAPRIVHFMAKESLFQSKLASFFFKILLVFPVSHGAADLRSIKKALKLLDKGKCFGIFPEGHRSALGGEMDRMQKGAAFIALRADAPIVPIYLSPDTFSKFRIRMAVGEAILPGEVRQQNTALKPVEAVTNAVTDALYRLRVQVEAMA